MFGQTQDGEFEEKKIDFIKIFWVQQPKKFKVFTWKQGASWKLLQSYNNYDGKISEIKVKGEHASSVMIEMEEPHFREDLGGNGIYSIRYIYIGYRAMKLKTLNCNAKKMCYKKFDQDQQFNFSYEMTTKAEEELNKLSLTFEKNVNAYRNLKEAMKYPLKEKEKALEY